MSNAVLPALAGLSFPVTKTPRWSNKIQTGTSGKETRIALWSYPIWEYELSFDVLRSDATGDLQTLAGFFNARQGSFDSFLFLDPDDSSVTGQNFGTGDGSTRSFQLSRSYGGYREPVTALNGAPQISRAGTLLTVTTDYTLSSTGLVTFTSAPASGAALTWTGNFYWRCRFLDDALSLEKFMASLWQLQSLRFQSVK